MIRFLLHAFIFLIFFHSTKVKAQNSIVLCPEENPEFRLKITDVLEEIRSRVGIPYKYGACDTSGTDCSGLIYQSFLSCGLKVPRSTSGLACFGEEIDPEFAAPGDFVFFSAKKGSNKITHVGVITEPCDSGSIMFIHASVKLGVTEEEFCVKHYQNLFVKIIRPFF